MGETLADKIAERLAKLKASREEHQGQLRQTQQTVSQLIQVINGETGAIAELEELFKLAQVKE